MSAVDRRPNPYPEGTFAHDQWELEESLRLLRLALFRPWIPFLSWLARSLNRFAKRVGL